MSAEHQAGGRSSPWPYVLGDILAYLVVSLYGFSTHGLIGRVSVERFLATFLPFTSAYLIFAIGLRVFQPGEAPLPGALWRTALSAILAAPIGAVVRGLWLGSSPIPVFVGVMAGVSSAFILAWRTAYVMVARRHLSPR